MSMTLSSLIEQLTDIQSRYGEELEVRLASQPRWAFEYSLQEEIGVAKIKGERVIYLAEGTQLRYLPQAVAVAVGWAEPKDDDEDYS
jgi:hypothetical protein